VPSIHRLASLFSLLITNQLPATSLKTAQILDRKLQVGTFDLLDCLFHDADIIVEGTVGKIDAVTFL